MRIGIVGISIEIMITSPLATSARSIQRYDSRAMLQDVWMIRGMLARIAEDKDIKAVPLCWATALPGGLVEAEAYREIKEEALRLIAERGPFDGILIANHGALEVSGLSIDGDTDYVTAIREAVGPDVPIGLSLDLHGDMTPGLLKAITVLSVLRTAPHRDDKETGYRAADQLIKVLRTGIGPKKAAVRIPILVPGETAVTANEPAGSLYGSLAAHDREADMMEANILVGFAWNDKPWTSVTAIAVSETSAEVARKQAMKLAREIWKRHTEFDLKMEHMGVAEGLKLALACAERPVYVSDSGDNTTAGAAGDLTLVLQAALDMNAAEDIVIAGITAPETVRELIKSGKGASAGIELGAEHLSRPKSARKVTAIVEACGEELAPSGFQPYRFKEGAWAKVRIGHVVATFHDGPVGITTPHHLAAMEIDPTKHKAYVVKLGYLHPQLEDIAARHILLLSDGTSQLDMTRLKWTALPRPAYPLDKDFAWDAARSIYGD